MCHCKDLIEVMPQVVHVVAYQAFERGRFIAVYQVERDLVQAMVLTSFRQDAFRYD
jgi:hypothetical protein